MNVLYLSKEPRRTERHLMPPQNEIGRVHERLDDLFHEMADMKADLKSMLAACSPCKEQVYIHERALFGNGSDGLKVKLEKLATEIAASRKHAGRLTVREIVTVLAAIGALITAMGTALLRPSHHQAVGGEPASRVSIPEK